MMSIDAPTRNEVNTNVPENSSSKKTWAEKAAVYQALIKDVNALNGRINCGRVALRVDELLRDGPKEGLRPVSTHDAGLYTVPLMEDDEIAGSYVTDERMLERVLKKRIVAKERIDLSDSVREVIELDVDEGALTANVNSKKTQKIEKQYFYRSSRDTLNQDLQKLRGRKRDGSKHGFIVLSHDIELGHLMNFVVDGEGDVFIIDGQPKDHTKRVTATIPEGYRAEIYYIDTNPPEGWLVKPEPKFAQEDVKMKSEHLVPKFTGIVPPQLQALLNAFCKQDEVEIDRLLKHTNLNAVIKNESIGYVIAKTNPSPALLELLIKKGTNLPHFAQGAAAGGHQRLMEYIFGLMRAKTPARKLNLQFYAEAAALGGHQRLMEYIFKLMRESTPVQEPNLQGCAETAALGGHKDVMEYIFKLMRESTPVQEPNLQACAEWATRNGQKDLMEDIFRLMRARTPVQEPNLQSCAVWAAGGGQKFILWYLFKKIYANGQIPNFKQCENNAQRNKRWNLVRDILAYPQRNVVSQSARTIQPMMPTYAMNAPGFYISPQASSVSSTSTHNSSMHTNSSSVASSLSSATSRASNMSIDSGVNANGNLQGSHLNVSGNLYLTTRVQILEAENRAKTQKIQELEQRLAAMEARLNQSWLPSVVQAQVVSSSSTQVTGKRKKRPGSE